MGTANHDELSDNAEIICYISDNYHECQSLQPSLGDSQEHWERCLTHGWWLVVREKGLVNVTSLPTLVVDNLCGDAIVANPSEGLTIGRDADLKVGEDNRYMHRIAMYVYAESGMWFLLNNCEHVTAMVHIPEVSRSFRLAPQQRFDLSYPEYFIRFSVKDDQYEIQIKQDIEHADAKVVLPTDGTETISVGELPERQRALIAAYAEDYLRGRIDTIMVSCTDAEAGRKLGGKTAKAVEHYRTALFESALSKGLVSSKEWQRVNQKSRLQLVVVAAIEARLVTADDLKLLA